MKLTLNEELASEIIHARTNEEVEDETGKIIYKIVDADEDWTGGDKYQNKSVIFSDNDGNLYCLNAAKTGSHYTDWYYEYELDCPQVFRKERVITEVYYE